MERPPFARTLLWMCSGIIVWALHFAVIYGMHAVTCALGHGEGTRLPWFDLSQAIILVTVVALGAALAITIRAALVRPGSFENQLTAGVGAIAAVTIVWQGFVPVLLLPACV